MHIRNQGRVANSRPVAKIKTGHVSQPITDADDATGRDRSYIATRPSWKQQKTKTKEEKKTLV